jgi:hypothetical protein
MHAKGGRYLKGVWAGLYQMNIVNKTKRDRDKNVDEWKAT